MTGITQSAYSDRQIVAWLRGLYTVALADGHYDPEEQDLIGQLTQDLADLNAVSRLEERIWAKIQKHQKTFCVLLY